MGKSCFVVSVIGEDGSDTRKYADKLFRYIIKPVAEKAGYTKIERGDHDYQPGMIPHQIITKILAYDLVIADLTEPNPNVYYELAVRHCVGKRYVQMVKQGIKLPFDVAPVRTASFGLEVDQADEGKAALLKQIEAAEQDAEPVMNPVTQTQVTVMAKSSGDATTGMLALLIEGQNTLFETMASLKAQLAAATTPLSLGHYLIGPQLFQPGPVATPGAGLAEAFSVTEKSVGLPPSPSATS
jgi:hypothetical protein